MLRVKGLSKTYWAKDGEVQAIGLLDFEVAKGEFVCIVGPSGAGKTTLLRCITGLLAPSKGEVYVAGQLVTEPPAQVAVVFQDYSRSLLPWLTVFDNIALPLKKKMKLREERRSAIARVLKAVDLVGFDQAYPWQLSGGMQQRVAIARALAYQPEVLIMDEPFASVDAQTRADLEDLVHQVRQDFNITVVLVTHDIDESVYLGDRVIVLSQKPSRVKDIITVDLPHPRDQNATKLLPQFGEIRSRILKEIRGCVVEKMV
ncbi:ABC transporter ATP-binding protein [Eoetvoesiella caeni]